MGKATKNWSVLVLFVTLLLTAPALLAPHGSWEIFTTEGVRKVTRVNINTATVEQLQRIPGISRDLAHRIVRYREIHGPFHKVDDLLDVEGVTKDKLDQMNAFITVKPADD